MSKDLEFMSETYAAVLEEKPWAAHIILWIAAILIVIALIWANVADIDEITRGTGSVIPAQESQIIQSLEGGIVSQIMVKEGDIVSKGQVLLIIDSTQFASDLRGTQIKILAMQAKILRLQAEVAGTTPVFSEIMYQAVNQMVIDQLALYRARQDDLQVKLQVAANQVKEKEQEIAELNKKRDKAKISLDLTSKELELTKPLVKQGAVSQVELLRLERTVNDLRGEVDASELALPRLASSLHTANQQANEIKLAFKIQAQTELSQTNAEYKSLQESNSALADKVERTSLRSPVNGTVNQININTIGGIIKAGEQMMEIIPLDDSLIIETEIKPSDIGFIKPDLNAVVKLTAYDFSIYGGLKGKVVNISPDTILNKKQESVYQIRVKTETNYLEHKGKRLPIIPGMHAQVDILTGHKTIMDYILKPILKTTQQALRER